MKSKIKSKLKQISQSRKSIASPGKSSSKGSASLIGKSTGSGKSSSSSKSATVLNTSGAVLPVPSSAAHRSKLREDARKAFSKK